MVLTTSPYEQPAASRMAPMFFITCSVSASMLSCTSSFVPGSSATQPETNSIPFALIACATGRDDVSPGTADHRVGRGQRGLRNSHTAGGRTCEYGPTAAGALSVDTTSPPANVRAPAPRGSRRRRPAAPPVAAPPRRAEAERPAPWAATARWSENVPASGRDGWNTIGDGPSPVLPPPPPPAALRVPPAGRCSAAAPR